MSKTTFQKTMEHMKEATNLSDEELLNIYCKFAFKQLSEGNPDLLPYEFYRDLLHEVLSDDQLAFITILVEKIPGLRHDNMARSVMGGLVSFYFKKVDLDFEGRI